MNEFINIITILFAIYPFDLKKIIKIKIKRGCVGGGIYDCLTSHPVRSVTIVKVIQCRKGNEHIKCRTIP